MTNNRVWVDGPAGKYIAFEYVLSLETLLAQHREALQRLQAICDERGMTEATAIAAEALLRSERQPE